MPTKKKTGITKKLAKPVKKKVTKAQKKKALDTVVAARREIVKLHRIMEKEEHVFNLDLDAYKIIKNQLPLLYQRLKQDKKYGPMMEKIENEYGDRL